MSQNQLGNPLSLRPFSRRTVLQGAGALGLAAAFGTRGVMIASAQATPDELDYPEVVITAIEYSFDMPATFESGFTKVTFNNQGTMDHHAMFMRVNEGSTVDEAKEALKQPDFGAVFAVTTGVGGPNCGPGETTSVIMDFQPGNYIVICAVPDENGVPHFALGMLNDVEVTEGASTAVAPTADATIHLVDFGFHDMPTELTAGPQVWEVVDDGPQVHEMGICALAPGFTFDQIQAIMTAPPAATPEGGEATADASPMAMDMSMAPPFTQVDGVAPMSAGETNWLLLDLAAGDYFAICYVPDPETGAPHFALGMMMPFTVA
jgi:hypothetical protein